MFADFKNFTLIGYLKISPASIFVPRCFFNIQMNGLCVYISYFVRLCKSLLTMFSPLVVFSMVSFSDKMKQNNCSVF